MLGKLKRGRSKRGRRSTMSWLEGIIKTTGRSVDELYPGHLEGLSTPVDTPGWGFIEGREETADNERSGRPSTSTTPEKVDKVLELVREDRQITVREVAEEAGISFGSTQSIMKDILGVRRLNAVLIPKDLSFDQKNARKETASLNLEATTDDPELLKRVITGDEILIYSFDSETTQQALEWRFKNEPRPKKARKAPSKVKVMLTVFFDYQGIVHHEFQQQGSTITADFQN
ncbi:hypothetical protein LAZ67_18001629 [Cordylochernes scorpioides]|uniref:Transposase n=1 Tax=Cordylochernes scorpioides TaxID=51811 RepID=A0ABY6LFW9_9ARAC|nr:hypothetical protein LAZ67_18001629 [Cordylochernes scorpioides]